MWDWLKFIIDELPTSIRAINIKLEGIVATQQEMQTALNRVESATTSAGVAATAIGARIEALETLIKGMGLDESQESQLLAQIEGVAANAESLAEALTAMGKTPETPVPVPPPSPVEPA